VGWLFATKVNKIKNKVYPAFFIIFLKEAGLSFQIMQEFSFSDITPLLKGDKLKQKYFLINKKHAPILIKGKGIRVFLQSVWDKI